MPPGAPQPLPDTRRAAGERDRRREPLPSPPSPTGLAGRGLGRTWPEPPLAAGQPWQRWLGVGLLALVMAAIVVPNRAASHSSTPSDASVPGGAARLDLEVPAAPTPTEPQPIAEPRR